MRRAAMRLLALALLSLAPPSAMAAPQSFAGVISDSECGNDHTSMRMADTDAACVKACLDAHGASYVLVVGSRVYALSDQRQPASFAGQKVTVIGTLDAAGRSIQIDSIVSRR